MDISCSMPDIYFPSQNLRLSRVEKFHSIPAKTNEHLFGGSGWEMEFWDTGTRTEPASRSNPLSQRFVVGIVLQLKSRWNARQKSAPPECCGILVKTPWHVVVCIGPSQPTMYFFHNAAVEATWSIQ
jgi:hypothetical protein